MLVIFNGGGNQSIYKKNLKNTDLPQATEKLYHIMYRACHTTYGN